MLYGVYWIHQLALRSSETKPDLPKSQDHRDTAPFTWDRIATYQKVMAMMSTEEARSPNPSRLDGDLEIAAAPR